MQESSLPSTVFSTWAHGFFPLVETKDWLLITRNISLSVVKSP